MAEQIGNDNDGILLLELGVETDQSAFNQARQALEDLRNEMDDISLGVDLSGLLSGLRNAASLLKGLIDGWNSLEDKAIDIAYTVNNNVPYNISEATRRNIEYGVSSSTVAQKAGLDSSDILSSMNSIQNAKAKTKNLGYDPNEPDWVSLTMLGHIMDDPRFMGDNLKNMLLFSTEEDTYLAITELLANAYRKLETYPDNSAQRDIVLQAINNVIGTPYISPDEANYIALMTKKENPTFGKAGNPMRQIVSGGLSDGGQPMENLTALTNENIDLANDMDILKARRQKATDWIESSVYNVLGKSIVKPFIQDPITQVLDWLSPETMSKNYLLETYNSASDYPKAWLDQLYAVSKGAVGYDYEAHYAEIASKFGLTAGWEQLEGSIEDKKLAMISRIAQNKDNPIASELGYYELMRMLQASYNTDARTLTTFAMEKLWKLPEFKGKNEAEMQEMMLDPTSKYYMGEGAFSDVYTMLYRVGAFGKNDNANTKEYLQTMAKVFENVNISEIARFFPNIEDSGTDIVKAKVKDVQSGFGKDWRLIITVQQSDGSTKDYSLTADQLASGMKVPGM